MAHTGVSSFLRMNSTLYSSAPRYRPWYHKVCLAHVSSLSDAVQSRGEVTRGRFSRAACEHKLHRGPEDPGSLTENKRFIYV